MLVEVALAAKARISQLRIGDGSKARPGMCRQLMTTTSPDPETGLNSKTMARSRRISARKTGGRTPTSQPCGMVGVGNKVIRQTSTSTNQHRISSSVGHLEAMLVVG